MDPQKKWADAKCYVCITRMALDRDNDHRYVRVEQKSVGYSWIEQACEYVFLFIGYRYQIDVSQLFNVAEIIYDSIEIEHLG